MKLFSLLPKRLIHFACNSPGPQKTRNTPPGGRPGKIDPAAAGAV